MDPLFVKLIFPKVRKDGPLGITLNPSHAQHQSNARARISFISLSADEVNFDKSSTDVFFYHHYWCLRRSKNESKPPNSSTATLIISIIFGIKLSIEKLTKQNTAADQYACVFFAKATRAERTSCKKSLVNSQVALIVLNALEQVLEVALTKTAERQERRTVVSTACSVLKKWGNDIFQIAVTSTNNKTKLLQRNIYLAEATASRLLDLGNVIDTAHSLRSMKKEGYTTVKAHVNSKRFLEVVQRGKL